MELFSLISAKENWLANRVRYLSLNQEFSKNILTSTAVVNSTIKKISVSLLSGINQNPDTDTTPPYHHDGKTHREFSLIKDILELNTDSGNQVSVSEAMILYRHYRQAFIDLINCFIDNERSKTCYRTFLDNRFNRFELDFVSDLGISKCLSDDDNFYSVKDSSPSNDRYIHLFRNFFVPLLIYDHINEQVYGNSKFEQLVSIYKTGHHDDNTITENLPDYLRSKIISFKSQSDIEAEFSTSFLTMEGTRQFNVRLKKIFDDKPVHYFTIAMLLDFTEQLNTEKSLQEEKNKAVETDRLKTAFLANMSHEIRTPMNAILGFTELLLNDKFLNIDRTEYLKLIRKSSNDLLNIIEDIIDIAKIESNQLKIKYKSCRPFDILSDLRIITQETLRRYGIEHDVELILEVEANEQNTEFYTDAERLKQVLSNLLNNAAKYTNQGSIRFGFKLIDQSNIFFYVRDTGMGIPEDMKERIFERFFQLDKHQSQKIGGSGLGLAICKNIIQLLGGKIWVESIEGKGSDFFFQLPYRKTTKSSIDQAKNYTVSDRIPDWSDRHFLIAEDDDINFLYLKEILKDTGARLSRALNGSEAINIAVTNKNLDLILMDIKMPEMSGLEASKYISAQRPEIPIIAQTAYAMEGDRIKCINAGCCDYITKPVDQKKLISIIQNFIKYPHQIMEQYSPF